MSAVLAVLVVGCREKQPAAPAVGAYGSISNVPTAKAVPALPELVAAPGLDEGLGLGEAAAGVGLKAAAPPRTAAATSPTIARCDGNGDR